MERAKQKIVIPQTSNEAMLLWPNKKPLTEIECNVPTTVSCYFGATESTLNSVIFGDNLDALSALLNTYEQKIDLIYIDPPFDSNANYYKKIKLKGEGTEAFSIKLQQYEDKWRQEDYLQFLYERLQILHMLLAETGSIYVHCDWRKSHYIRLMLDELFGAENFRNEIIWRRGTVKGAKAKGKQFARNHDTIFYYTKSSTYTFNRQYVPFEQNYVKRFNKDDGDGRGPYRDDQAIGTRSQQSIEEMKSSGKIFEADGKLRIKTYLNELQGVVVDDNWGDIAEVNVMSKDRTMYPTQKPELLLNRIIQASSKKGDIVLDCFSGSGTTAYTAAKLGRKFIAIDNNICAVLTTANRLQSLRKSFTIQTVNCKWPTLETALHYTVSNKTFTITELDLSQVRAQYGILSTVKWQQLIEQIEIDEQYNGTVFRPTIMSTATNHHCIQTSFKLSTETSTIAIQLTDVFMNIYKFTINR